MQRARLRAPREIGEFGQANRVGGMRDAAHFRARAQRCRELMREARRADVQEALASLARDYEAEANALESAEQAAEAKGGLGEDRTARCTAEG
jgi:hypothetical protein